MGRSDIHNNPISHCVIIDDMEIDHIATWDSMKYIFKLYFFLWPLLIPKHRKMHEKYYSLVYTVTFMSKFVRQEK